MSTANKAVAINRLYHIPHVDDLDLVDDAALTNPLKNHQNKKKIQFTIKLIAFSLQQVIDSLSFQGHAFTRWCLSQ